MGGGWGGAECVHACVYRCVSVASAIVKCPVLPLYKVPCASTLCVRWVLYKVPFLLLLKELQHNLISMKSLMGDWMWIVTLAKLLGFFFHALNQMYFSKKKIQGSLHGSVQSHQNF